MWNLTYDTSELIFKTVTDTDTDEKLVGAKGVGEGTTGSLG